MSNAEDPRSEDAFLKGAYELSDAASAMAFYSEWADEYDDRMETVLGYVAPRLMAEKFAGGLQDIETATVLDVGCGTGLTSHYLWQNGARTIDGVDLNQQMLTKAKSRGIYRDLIHADITQPIDLPSGAYDGIISSGTFTLGHVGSEPIPELVRLLKPGGTLGCTIHIDIWTRDGFADRFAGLEAAGRIQTVTRDPGEFFTGYGETAYYCLFKKNLRFLVPSRR